MLLAPDRANCCNIHPLHGGVVRRYGEEGRHLAYLNEQLRERGGQGPDSIDFKNRLEDKLKIMHVKLYEEQYFLL